MGQENLSINDQNRIFAIDVMRGIAILGIFLVNMYSFHTPFLYGDSLSFAKSDVDKFVYQLVDFFAQASFYPLFAFLFGYGLVILQVRTQGREQNFKVIAIRRMTVLLVIGIIHAFFVWSGDILITYAVLGFMLIIVINLSSRVLMIIASLIYLIPSILLLLLFILGDILMAGEITQELYAPSHEQVVAIYQQGSFPEITLQRFSDWAYTNIDGALILAFTVFPLLLFGVIFAKEKLLQPSERNRLFYKKMLLIFLPLGIIFKLTPYLVGDSLSVMFFQDQFGGVTLTVAYISIIFLLCYSSRLAKILKSLSHVGKLSLSNYLFQSVVCTLIFYGYGLGFYGKVSYLTSTILAIFIYIIQIVISNIWLKYYRQGPVEWLWRGLTYGHFLKNKREKGME